MFKFIEEYFELLVLALAAVAVTLLVVLAPVAQPLVTQPLAAVEPVFSEQEFIELCGMELGNPTNIYCHQGDESMDKAYTLLSNGHSHQFVCEVVLDGVSTYDNGRNSNVCARTKYGLLEL